jgi:hypothetical protein
MLLMASLAFAVFFANVLAGALAGQPFLSDIFEMLALFVASGFFVAGVLRLEERSKGGGNDTG